MLKAKINTLQTGFFLSCPSMQYLHSVFKDCQFPAFSLSHSFCKYLWVPALCKSTVLAACTLTETTVTKAGCHTTHNLLEEIMCPDVSRYTQMLPGNFTAAHKLAWPVWNPQLAPWLKQIPGPPLLCSWVCCRDWAPAPHDSGDSAEEFEAGRVASHATWSSTILVTLNLTLQWLPEPGLSKRWLTALCTLLTVKCKPVFILSQWAHSTDQSSFSSILKSWGIKFSPSFYSNNISGKVMEVIRVCLVPGRRWISIWNEHICWRRRLEKNYGCSGRERWLS